MKGALCTRGGLCSDIRGKLSSCVGGRSHVLVGGVTSSIRCRGVVLYKRKGCVF